MLTYFLTSNDVRDNDSELYSDLAWLDWFTINIYFTAKYICFDKQFEQAFFTLDGD